MSTKKNILLATVSAAVLALSAPAYAQNTDANVTVVSPDGPAEQAGEAVDNAAENTAEAASDAANATMDAADSAADATAATAAGAADATADAADNAADAAQGAADTAEAAADSAEDAADEAPQIAEGTPVEGQIFEQSADSFLASTLLDAAVMNSADEKIGDVNNLVMSSEGQVTGVVIGVGGFLGIGEKQVAIELQKINITNDDDGDLVFMLDTTKADLEAAPEFMTQQDVEAEQAASAAPTAGTGGTMAPATAPTNTN